MPKPNSAREWIIWLEEKGEGVESPPPQNYGEMFGGSFGDLRDLVCDIRAAAMRTGYYHEMRDHFLRGIPLKPGQRLTLAIQEFEYMLRMTKPPYITGTCWHDEKYYLTREQILCYNSKIEKVKVRLK